MNIKTYITNKDIFTNKSPSISYSLMSNASLLAFPLAAAAGRRGLFTLTYEGSSNKPPSLTPTERERETEDCEVKVS